MASINIPIISEAEYASFRSIGVISQFPKDYSSFVKLMGEEIKERCHGGVIPVEIKINFSEFKQWLGTRHATYNDLLNYAATIVNP